MMQTRETLSFQNLKMSNEARLADEERLERRKKNALVLILHHLQAFGYIDSASRLQSESGVSLSHVTVADNVDLLTVMQEYESYYTFKFGRAPRMTRKSDGYRDDIAKPTRPRPSAPAPPKPPPHSSISSAYQSAADDGTPTLRPLAFPKLGYLHPGVNLGQTNSAPAAGQVALKSKSKPALEPINGAKPPATVSGPGRPGAAHDTVESADSAATLMGMDVVGTNFSKPHKAEHDDRPVTPTSRQVDRLLKPLPDFGTSELRDLAAVISREIFVENPNVKWSDIAGLSDAKRLVQESVIYPLKYPQLFTGLLTPWKGLLLYGPPGTGKTMLARALATSCKTTFFNISASSIVSKWRGDSEKLVRVLFELARYHAPSTVFIDEIESIMGQRQGEGNEHEGSRRMKTELLVQIDGLAAGAEGEREGGGSGEMQDPAARKHVFLLAATNMPWDLDVAMLRRLEKRIHVDLPSHDARRAMFARYLDPSARDGFGNPITSPYLDLDALAARTEGYSGADIKLVCKEAAMRPVREIMERLEGEVNAVEQGQEQADGVDGGKGKTMQRRTVDMGDVEDAIERTCPSCDGRMSEKYAQWAKSFGSV
ncbi:AAA-domain-containing protein [Gonapodya prolifera JEL478]|uniref:Katanin p60 ATPase-containing subunit A-like 2 n=1 Tax=Gonapodya prolifera (strain JEL478) TaxID=1344416 RepID=A0A139AGZ7_GONPJ|nr:AAA-domain-containing protein [Gonapodya prolifera JEL478]|eukprot:KXS15834.1 AAA-domain-containing protein [Gonapodya prolifera JEL478]